MSISGINLYLNLRLIVLILIVDNDFSHGGKYLLAQ